MKTIRNLFLTIIPLLALTSTVAPAGSQTSGCTSTSGDPGIRAAFAEFERHQSRTAAKICAFYLNTLSR